MPPSGGEIRIEGEPVAFASPQDAATCGIATIFQELALSENLSIAENVFLGREIVTRDCWACRSCAAAPCAVRVGGLLQELDAHIPDPGAAGRQPVGRPASGRRDLPGAQPRRQARHHGRADGGACRRRDPQGAGARAAPRRAGLRRRADLATISSDVFEVADRMVVFRRGRKIAERRREATHPEEIVSLITGAHPDARALEAMA